MLNKYQIKFIYSLDGRKARKYIIAKNKKEAMELFEKNYEGWVVEVYSIDLIEENVEPSKYKKKKEGKLYERKRITRSII